ncbi:MAG: Hsp70 family protein [Clostridiales bacterium]|mgnify:CR=1 FL=1|nr:Hsp70 family protein [Clostridiales bacterium]
MVIGIDLGTTYSVAAYMNDKGEPEVIANSEGDYLTPSVVFFENNGKNAIVGEVAKDNSILKPDDTIATVKNFMGRKTSFQTGEGLDYSPEMVSSLIIKKLCQDASKSLNQEIKDVVITIPAYFNDAQRQSTIDAAKGAGVNLIKMINEPTAAACYFAYKTKLQKANILVYDLGGGTFDTSVVTIDGKNINVVRTEGIHELGGVFFDESIVELICKYMLQEKNIDLRATEYKQDLQQLYLMVEKYKIQLSSRQEVRIPVTAGAVRESFKLTRTEFDKIVEKYYKKTERKIKMVLSKAHMTINDIDKILMVGGSSRIPFIKKSLTEYFGKEPSTEVHADESVALGAAIYASMQEDDENLKIQDVCSHAFGIATYSEKKKEKINTIVIEKCSAIPVSRVRQFKLAVDNQKSLQITLTEGESEELKYVNIIDDFQLDLPPGTRKNMPVEVIYTLDGNQIIHISINIPELKFRHEYKINRSSNLNEDQLEMMTSLISSTDVE